MAEWRRAVELAMTCEEIERLTTFFRGRELDRRAGIAGADAAGLSRRSFVLCGGAKSWDSPSNSSALCVERALSYEPLAAIEDRPRPGKEPVITPEAKPGWCRWRATRPRSTAIHAVWTTRLLARHAREHGPTAGHECLAGPVQGTVCKILGQEELKPHKVRYYLERRDAEFEQKMAEVLCVYHGSGSEEGRRQVAQSHQASGDRYHRRKAAESGHRNDSTRFAAQARRPATFARD